MQLWNMETLALCAILPGVASILNATVYTDTATSWVNPPCGALIEAGLGERILSPDDPAYATQIDSWWALNSRLTPWCLFMPRSTSEVAKGLSALHEAGPGAGDWHIAVRSGGHNSAGGSNIQNGVTIDLSNMNQSSYNVNTNIASIQSGARWKQVYADLLRWNVTTTGGRDGGVGVGGFLLGGGLTFFMGRRGFGCDSVMGYEVVLANGTIVNATKHHNSDLWQALRGGGPNFGIVTQYHMDALPGNNISITSSVMSLEYSEQALHSLADFTLLSEGQAANDALVLYYSYNGTQTNETYISILAANTVGNADSPALAPIKSIPALVTTTDLESMAASAEGSQLAGGTRNAGATLTFQLDIPTMRHAVQLNNNLIARLTRLIGAENFSSFLFLQPLPTYYTAITNRRGGNMLRPELSTHNAIMWTAGIALTPNTHPAKLAEAHQYLGEMAAQVRQFAKEKGKDLEFVYMNYADAGQDPLGSYGKDNVAFLKSVAKKYDPEGFFQERVPGGFKISRVV